MALCVAAIMLVSLAVGVHGRPPSGATEALPDLALADPNVAATGSCALVSSFVKVRPQDFPPSLQASSHRPFLFSATMGETASFQVVCSGPLDALSLNLSFADADRKPLPLKAVLYSEAYILASNVSDCSGRLGLWPDPLVPFVDPWFEEERVITTAVPAFQTRAFWVDIAIPRKCGDGEENTEAGIQGSCIRPALFNGSVVIKGIGFASNNGATNESNFNTLELPFSLRVRNISLPATSPFSTYFAFEPTLICQGNGSSPSPFCSNEGAIEQSLRAADLLLANRISAGNVFEVSEQLGPDSVSNGPTNVDWLAFEAVWGRYLFTSDNHSKGALMNSFSMPKPFCEVFDPASPSYCGDVNVQATCLRWRETMAWAKDRGIADKLFVYGIDEPTSPEQWAELKAVSAVAREADPSLRVLATASITAATAAGAEKEVSLFCPLIQELDVKSSCWSPNGRQSARYHDLPFSTAVGGGSKKLWSYQSCVSHGCDHDSQPSCLQLSTNEQDASYTGCETGWPSIMLDSSMVANRVFSWTTFLNEFQGQLYWQSNFLGSTGQNPWTSLWAFGGNGDGQLLYPGLPSIIGGSREIPVGSLRIKAIRDGEEDLMLLRLAEEKLGSRQAVLDAIAPFITASYSFQDDASVMQSVLERVMDLAEFGATKQD